MLYIKNGRIYTLGFSFELPEDMSIVTDPAGVSPDTLVLETYDGKYQIEIGAWTKEQSPQEQVEEYINYASHIKMSEIFKVERGEMKGVAAFHHTESWREEHYDERLSFPMNEDGQNTLVFAISHEIFDEKERNSLESFIQRPNIKRFIDSIRYETSVCENIIKGEN